MRRMTVDTVVVGAGSAGCVVAERLSRTERVALLEAGPELVAPGEDMMDGGRNAPLRYDWGLTHRVLSVPVTSPYPRGRLLGGSSMVNTCIALRPSREDLAPWVERGLPMWSFDELLPSFCAIESDREFGEEPYHGADGPLPVQRDPVEQWTPWAAGFVEAARELGIPRCHDTNAPGAHGVGPHAFNRVDGRRVGAAPAWLRPEVRARAALTVHTDCLVHRVRFEGRRAVGVEACDAESDLLVHARRVVLCAGAIHTPGILLRSGVGPSAELHRLGVHRVADVPGVGARLGDHPGTALFFLPKRGAAPAGAPLLQTVLRIPSEVSGHATDLQIQPGNSVPLPWTPTPLVSVMMHLGTPRAWGRLQFPSADVQARPHIDIAAWTHPDDVRRGIEVLEVAHALAQTRPLRGLIQRPILPMRRGRRADLARHALNWCDSGYHPCCTTPMGEAQDPMAVCDGWGRVRAVEGLHIVDAGLMPTVPAPNLHLLVLAMADKLARHLAGQDSSSGS